MTRAAMAARSWEDLTGLACRGWRARRGCGQWAAGESPWAIPERKSGAMDSEQFDTLTRSLALGLSRRSAIAGLAALTGLNLAQIDQAAAKKKRRKKKKKKGSSSSPPPPPRQSPPPPRCLPQCAASNACGADG